MTPQLGKSEENLGKTSFYFAPTTECGQGAPEWYKDIKNALATYSRQPQPPQEHQPPLHFDGHKNLKN